MIDPTPEFRKGFQCHQAGNLREAETCYRNVLQVNPRHTDALHLLGVLAYQEGKWNLSVTLIQEAIRFNPRNAFFFSNLANVFQTRGEWEKALGGYRKALSLKADASEIHFSMGDAFFNMARYDEAMACYRKAVELNPHFTQAISHLCHTLRKICDWSDLDVLYAALDESIAGDLEGGRKPAETPYYNLMRQADPSRNYVIASHWSAETAAIMNNNRRPFAFHPRESIDRKITLGYISNDFHNHPVAHLCVGLFQNHDHSQFNIFCYSTGMDDGSYYRKKIMRDCDRFVDIAGMEYSACANRVYQDQVDILIDLSCLAEGNKLAVCAMRPAPIQVNWLGYPGTTGARFMDYIITDRIITPAEHAPYYSEKIVYLPHCYQINDRDQRISSKIYTRADFNLPAKGTIFGCFNGSQKIDPTVFDCWMTILMQVPGSYLWLLKDNETAARFLIENAAQQGLDPKRLIFGKPMSKEEHLSRLRLIDLGLDTVTCNGHTTTSDALWAGVPVVTKKGSHFTSRVAASILSAVGLTELVTEDLSNYKNLAVRLGSNRAELNALKEKLNKNKNKEPLFDTGRFVKNLEQAYKKMWRIYLSGKSPEPIEVTE